MFNIWMEAPLITNLQNNQNRWATLSFQEFLCCQVKRMKETESCDKLESLPEDLFETNSFGDCKQSTLKSVPESYNFSSWKSFCYRNNRVCYKHKRWQIIEVTECYKSGLSSINLIYIHIIIYNHSQRFDCYGTVLTTRNMVLKFCLFKT